MNSIAPFTEVLFTLIDNTIDCNILFCEQLYKLEDYISNVILTTGI